MRDASLIAAGLTPDKATVTCCYIWKTGWRIGITSLSKDELLRYVLRHTDAPHERTTMKAALFIAVLVALPLAAHAQTKQVPPKPALETNLSTAAEDPSAKAKALEAQQEARQKAWEEKARRLSRSICTGC